MKHYLRIITKNTGNKPRNEQKYYDCTDKVAMTYLLIL